MAGIDGILNIVVEQDATELRLGTGRVPKLFRHGNPKRFLMPETSETTLRDLLDEVLTDHELDLERLGHVVFAYNGFDVSLRQRYEGQDDDSEEDDPGDLHGVRAVVGFDVVFRREAPVDRDDPGRGGSVETPHRGGVAAPFHAVAPRTDDASDPQAPRFAPIAEDRPQPNQELAALLQRAVAAHASDLHLSSDQPPTLRVDGRLRVVSGEAVAIMELLLDGCLTSSVRDALGRGLSADFSFTIPTVGRFRGNIYQSMGGLSAAFRILPSRTPTLDELGLPAELRSLVAVPNGLAIVCGPTGSGKSATMAALVQEILDTSPSLVIALEDPIEYHLRPARHGGIVRQREVGTDVCDFATGLRDALREDPDVLLVGEMRDVETITAALTAAETGHLVISSLHSRSTAGAVERIADTYPPERQTQIRVQLADSLRAVVSQRLVPSLGGTGRVPALEILPVTHAVEALIRAGKTAQIPSTIQAGGGDGMISLERSLARLVRAHQIDMRDARRVANDLTSLNHYLRER